MGNFGLELNCNKHSGAVGAVFNYCHFIEKNSCKIDYIFTHLLILN